MAADRLAPPAWPWWPWNESGRLAPAAVAQTSATIARVQRGDGSIPWYAHGPVDPWDHVEAAMGLSVAGYREAAQHAYRWLRRTQRADGSWPSRIVRGQVTDGSRDANFAAYVAVGVLFETLASGDVSFASRSWPTVERAIEFALRLQAAQGQVWWARDPGGEVYPQALLTASCGVLLSLRCACALADLLGRDRPEWELAVTRLAGAIRYEPGLFAPAGRHAMDWYWPVLAGAFSGEDGLARLDESWTRYVTADLGVRCVDDRQWVTAAESAELAMALSVCGATDRARAVLIDIQHLRDPDGSYWTGYVWPDTARWPVERTTWTAGAVLLADQALEQNSVCSQVLRVRADLVTGVAVPATNR